MNIFRDLLWIFGVSMAIVGVITGIVALEEIRYDEIPSAKALFKILQFLAVGSITLLLLAVKL